MSDKKVLLKIFGALIFLGGIYVLGYTAKQTDTTLILLTYGIICGIYWMFLASKSYRFSVREGISLGLAGKC